MNVALVKVLLETIDYSTLKQSAMPFMQCLDQLALVLTSQSTPSSPTAEPGPAFISVRENVNKLALGPPVVLLECADL